MDVDEGFYQKSDIQPHWMAAHARLKNEFTEDKKGHNGSYCEYSLELFGRTILMSTHNKFVCGQV